VSCIGELTEPISLPEVRFRSPTRTSRFCRIFTPYHEIASKDVSAQSLMIELCIRKPQEVFVGGGTKPSANKAEQPAAPPWKISTKRVKFKEDDAAEGLDVCKLRALTREDLRPSR
jgi:hypothetical protein